MISYGIAILCVFGLVAGQLLFKLGAGLSAHDGTMLSPNVLAALIGAISIYGVTSAAWVWVLQRAELGKLYPLMALAFILVPIGSHYAFGERFSSPYFIGVAFITVGIIITTIA